MQPMSIPNRRTSHMVAVMLVLAVLGLVRAGAAEAQCGPCERRIGSDCGVTGCRPICAPDPSRVGTVCHVGSGDMCDPDELCDANGECPIWDEYEFSSTLCRPVAGGCDVGPEYCPGIPGAACPAQVLRPAGTVCRGASGACDVAETCNGVSGICPADVLRDAGTVCRDAAGPCDVAELCTGTSGTCPGNAFKSTATVCRAAGGVCDVAETCTGSSAACPADSTLGERSVCRPPAGDCDVAEMCPGGSVDCPADGFASAGTVCRAVAGVCDVEETCAGDTAVCPTDAFVDAATACRASGGECDPGESCSGDAADCPADTKAEPDTPCSDDADACTLDVCDATGSCAHEPTADTDGDGTCDATDPCTNLGGAQDFAAGTKSKLQLTKIGTQTVPNDDGLLLQGVFDLPAGRRFGDLALETTGVRLVVRNGDGDLRVDVTLPGGAYAGGRTRGWTRSGNGKTVTYQDKTGAPEHGIVKLQVGNKAKADAPGRVQVKVTGKGGTYPVAAADVPLDAVITLGTQADAAAGLCGESAYVAADCTVKASGDAIGCKQ